MKRIGLMIALLFPLFAVCDEYQLSVSEKLALVGGDAGNADVYSGGEPRLERIELARRRISQTLGYLVRKPDLSACSSLRCEKGKSPALCALMQSMSSANRSACDRFLKKNGRAVLAIVDSASSSSFALSTTPIILGNRRVAAMTSSEGRIVLHAPTVDGLAEDELLALLFHEFGHKLRGVGKSRDEERLLDSTGIAVAWQSIIAALPSQEPPSMSPTSWRAFCRGTDPERMGMLADVAGAITDVSRIPASTFGLEVVKLEPARLRWIRAVFKTYLRREPLPEEEKFFLGRFRDGEGLDSVLASVVGTPEYAPAETPAFIARFFVDFLGRGAKVEELKTAESELRRFDRASWVLSVFRNSGEAQERLIRVWYQDYLNRQPSGTEVEDERSRITAGETWETIQAGILAGPEYSALQRKRFAKCDNK